MSSTCGARSLWSSITLAELKHIFLSNCLKYILENCSLNANTFMQGTAFEFGHCFKGHLILFSFFLLGRRGNSEETSISNLIYRLHCK